MKSKDQSAPKRLCAGDAGTAKFSALLFSRLSGPRQALVRFCQAVNYGSIQDLSVKDCEPVLSPAPVTLLDVKLDSDDVPRPEISLDDFALPAEVCRLLARLDELSTGTINRIEVRAGVPRRMVLRAAPQNGLPAQIGERDHQDDGIEPGDREGGNL